MSEPSKPTLDYAKPQKPRYSRFALVSIGIAGAIAAVVNAVVAGAITAAVDFTLADDGITGIIGLLPGVALILEVIGFSVLGFYLSAPRRGRAVRAFGLGIVSVVTIFLGLAIVGGFIAFVYAFVR